MENQPVSKNIEKVSQALGFLLSLDDNHKMERVKLIKLLWAADRLHVRRYGRTITESPYFALPHGPVCSLALDIAQMNGDSIALSRSDYNFIEDHFTADNKETSMQKDLGDDLLSESEKSALKDSWEMFKDERTFTFSDDISHRYPEWSKYSAFFESNSGRKPIDIADFFKDPSNDQFFHEDAERLEAARELYEENSAAQRELEYIFGG